MLGRAIQSNDEQGMVILLKIVSFISLHTEQSLMIPLSMTIPFETPFFQMPNIKIAHQYSISNSMYFHNHYHTRNAYYILYFHYITFQLLIQQIKFSASISPLLFAQIDSSSGQGPIGVCKVKGGDFLLEYFRYMANLLVSTANADERARLEEQFSARGSRFEVPREATDTLEAILRAISFEYFQNVPPPLILKILAFAENAIAGHFSLILLREVFAKIKNLEDLLAMYQGYFRSIGMEVGDRDPSSDDVGQSEDYSVGEENDHLFELAARGEMRMTRNIDNTDFQQAFEISIKHHYPMAVSQKTQVPSVHRINPEERQRRETLDDSCKQSHIFYTTEAYYGQEWWKQEKSDSSKEISKFQCRATNPLNQKSIGKLVIEEFKYDLNRQIELGKEMNRCEDVEAFKYRKMMKDKLLSAKLKKKKKK